MLSQWYIAMGPQLLLGKTSSAHINDQANVSDRLPNQQLAAHLLSCIFLVLAKHRSVISSRQEPD